MRARSTTSKAHAIFGRIGFGMTAVVWLSLALIDVFVEHKSVGDAALGVGLALLWVLLAAGPYLIYLRYTETPVPTVLTGVMLNTVMASMQVVAIFSKDGQAGLALIWGIVGGYLVVGAGVFLENAFFGYRDGETRTDEVAEPTTSA